MRTYLPFLIFFLSTSAPIALADSEICVTLIGEPCTTIDAYQPSSEKMKNVTPIYDTGVDDFTFTMYGNKQATIIVENVPFAKYWQLNDPKKYVFHPMVYGRYVFENVDEIPLDTLLKITERTAVRLPDAAGNAWYYPNHYPLNRMKGPDLVYSAISQSEILAGYLRYHLENPSLKTFNLLQSALKPLFYPHSRGGVDLGVAQLELPLFRSNPEIILNGWLHALLHLNDYAKIMGSNEIAHYVQSNLKFFAKNHEAWYDNARSISRYSDTSPQRIVVTPSSSDQTFKVVFKSRVTELPNYTFEPVLDLNNEYSAFDTRILAVNPANNKRTMAVNCSTLFDTVLASDAAFSIAVKEGGYSPYRATPSGSGKWQTIVASAFEGTVMGTVKDPVESPAAKHIYSATLSLPDEELICGYPTNFSKANKTNFYHMQHIVALMYLSKDSVYEDHDLNEELEEIALRWLQRTGQFEPKELQFEHPQKVLSSINRGKVRQPFKDIEELIPTVFDYPVNFKPVKKR